MKPHQSHDPFDPDFDAEDDFTSVEDAWREPPPVAAAADPFAPEALEEVEPERFGAVLWVAHRTLPAAYEARLAGKRVIYRPGVEQA